jgi:hypothetical protein
MVRYIVNDVNEAIGFYTKMLDFHFDIHPAPAFAILSRGELRCSSVSLAPEVVARPCRPALDRHRVAGLVIVVNN